jgi:hypothetical protein
VDLVARTESGFAALGSEYRTRKERAEAVVCDWKWAKWSWFDPRPLYLERHGSAPGRQLRQHPVSPRSGVSCGLDRSGRVTVERQFNEFGFYETFYDWSAEPLEVAHFDYSAEKRPINLLIVLMEAGRAVASFVAAIYGFTREEYRWDGPLVREVDVYHAEREDGHLPPLQRWHTAKAQYTGKGVLERVEIVWPPSHSDRPDEVAKVVFERRGKRIFRRR